MNFMVDLISTTNCEVRQHLSHVGGLLCIRQAKRSRHMEDTFNFNVIGGNVSGFLFVRMNVQQRRLCVRACAASAAKKKSKLTS